MRKGFCWLSLIFALGSGSVLSATPSEWKQSAYAYEAHETQLSVVLKDFAATFGVTLDMSPEVVGDGVLDGRIRATSAEAFLGRLGIEQHFQWFVFNDTLYISPLSEQVSRKIEVSPDTVNDLKDALTDVGLLDSRFGWGLLAEQGVVLVRGPRRYVEFIKEYSGNVLGAEEKKSVIYIPLHYASAADRVSNYRGEAINIPGVATLLQDLLQAGGSRISRSFTDVVGSPERNESKNNAVINSNNSGNFISKTTDSRASFTAHSSEAGRSKGGIRVTADVRNNALMIYDSPERKPLYQTLIKQMDVPRNLIEIDAIIFEIDRNQMAELSSRWKFNSGGVSGGGSLMDAGSASVLSIQDRGKFAAELRALVGKGAASVIGNPSILTVENQPAVIDFSRTEYVSTVGERVANLTPITAGTSLQVVPRAMKKTGTTSVHMSVDIEDGQIDTSQINVDLPSVRRNTISTQATIGENGSLVIGGLHVQEADDKNTKIPILGDIPWLGKLLFQSRSREVTLRERLFILTPRLVGDQINPARYVDHGNLHEVDDVVKGIAKRHSDITLPSRGDVSQIFNTLINGEIPEHLARSEEIPFVSSGLCGFNNGLVVDERAQWYAEKDWGVAVVLVRNVTAGRIRIDESMCGGRWALGVSVFPRAWLSAGESAEVYVALRKPKAILGKDQRISLMEGVTQ